MEHLVEQFIELLTLYHVPATFAGAFLFGESVIVTAAYLAADFDWNIGIISLAAFMGTVCADSAWFLVGRILRTRMPKRFEPHTERAERLIESLTGKRPFLALLFIKFLYGSRVAMIMYLAARRISFPQFFVYNALGTVIWLAVIVPVGYFASLGVGRPESVLSTVQIAIVVFIVSMVLFRLLSIWLTKRIEHE